MALRNGSRKISFEVLSVDGESESNEHSRRKRRHRASKRKKKLLDRADSVDPHIEPLENGGACNGFELDANRYSAGGGSVVYEEVREASVCAVVDAREAESEAPTAVRGGIEGFNFGKLRQRNVSCGSADDFPTSVVRDEKEEGGVKASPVEKPTNEPDRNVATKLETVESLDWKRLMEEDPNCEWYNGPYSACIILHLMIIIAMIFRKIDPTKNANKCVTTKLCMGFEGEMTRKIDVRLVLCPPLVMALVAWLIGYCKL